MLRIELSNRKGKRFVAIFRHGTKVHFGSSEGSTYIDHGDKAKRAAYIARHGASGKENWETPYTPGSLSLDFIGRLHLDRRERRCIQTEILAVQRITAA